MNGIDYKRPVVVSQSLLIRRSAQFRSCRSKRWECTEATYIGGIIPILLKQEEQENDADNPVRLMVGAAAPRMAYFAIPRYIATRDAMPKTPSERVEKFKLKNEGITDDCWDREAEGVEFAR